MLYINWIKKDLSMNDCYLNVLDLGYREYKETWDIQKNILQKVKN